MCDRQEELAAEFIKDEACLKAHELLTACMTEHNRSWSKCQVLFVSQLAVFHPRDLSHNRLFMQAQVKLLKACRDIESGTSKTGPSTTLVTVSAVPSGDAVTRGK